jgi:hypothetical protein
MKFDIFLTGIFIAYTSMLTLAYLKNVDFIELKIVLYIIIFVCWIICLKNLDWDE